MHDYWTLMKKLIWLRILQGASFVVNKITGTSPITLTNAINSAIISLKQYGKCVQDGTSPVNIMCNNGILKWDSVNQRIYADGTPEEIVVSATGVEDQTATAENLFAVDDIVDEQDIITGKVIRRTEAVVSDGTTPSGRYVGEVGEGNIIVKARETGYTGEIVSFTTEEETPLNGLRVKLEPIQDLHGYDAPWPAGGGKNKFDVDKMVNTSSITISNGVITVTGNAQNSTKKLGELADLTVGETYTLTATYTATQNFIYLYGSNTSWYFGTNRTITQSDVDSLVFLYGGMDTTNTISNFMIRLSFVTDATFAPYSNICPISGHTDADVTRTGVNVWDEEWELGRISTVNGSNVASITQIRSKNMIPVKGSTTYYFKTPVYGLWTFFYDKDGTAIASGAPSGYAVADNAVKLGGSEQPSTYSVFTTPANACFCRFYFQGGYGTTYNNDTSINYPSTDHDYHAYVGTTYPIPLGQTVYGGTLDVLTGVLTIDRAEQDMGQKNYVYRNGCFDTTIGGGKLKSYSSAEAKAICSSYKQMAKTYSFLADGQMCFGSGYVNGSTCSAIFKNTQYTDAASFKTAMSGVQLVYELANPQTIQLTPQQVELLQGENNIWSNGKSVNVYVSDGELIVQVTPQKLKTAEGTNVVEVTSNVDPVTLEVEYKVNR